MLKKTFFLATMLSFILSNGAPLFQITDDAGAAVIFEGQNLPPSTSPTECQYCPASGSVEQEDLENQMQEVFEELRKLEEMVKKKMNQDVLPRIQEEIRRLKEWLEKHEKKEDHPSPQWTNPEPPSPRRILA